MRVLTSRTPCSWGIILHIRTEKGYSGKEAMCTNNAQLSTGPEFPWKIISDPYQCLFFSGQISPFLTNQLRRFWIFFLLQIQLIFFCFEKKIPNFDMKNLKTKKYWSLTGIKNQYILFLFLKMNLCDFIWEERRNQPCRGEPFFVEAEILCIRQPLAYTKKISVDSLHKYKRLGQWKRCPCWFTSGICWRSFEKWQWGHFGEVLVEGNLLPSLLKYLLSCPKT